jgi:hypothetical protein
MHFHRDGDVTVAVQISGPTHNMLGLRLTQGTVWDPVVEAHEVTPGLPPRLLGRDIQRQVGEGVAEANDALGTDYRVALIRFVQDDSPSPSLYREMARRIVYEVHSRAGGDAPPRSGE